MENPFRLARERKSITRMELSKVLELPRSALETLESDDWQKSRLEHVIQVAKYLQMPLSKALLSKFDFDIEKDSFNEEEFEELVARFAQARITILLTELKEFCNLSKVRLDDYDITEMSYSYKNLHKLIVLNQKLKNKEIQPKEALQDFPPTHGKHSRRKE